MMNYSQSNPPDLIRTLLLLPAVLHLLLLVYPATTQGAVTCTETDPNIPVSLFWAGASPDDVSTLNGSTSTPGHLQGRLKQCITDGSTPGEEGVFEWLPPVAGDSAFFVGEINGPNSVALNGPDFNFVSIRMGNANFTGSLHANDVVIQEYLLNSQMNFNGVHILAEDGILIDSNDGEETPDLDLRVTFTGGTLATPKDINIGAFARATTQIDMTGVTLTADKLNIQPSFDGGGFVDMTIKGGQSSVGKDVLIGEVVNGETNLTIDDGAEVQWASGSGFTTIAHSGDVNLDIKGGSDVNTHETFIGFQPESHAKITIENAKWTTGNLVVSGFGDVEITANDGAELSSQNVTIGSFERSTVKDALVTMNGDAKWDIEGFMTLGANGSGKLVLNDDSTVDVFGLAIISENAKGELEVHSGNTFNAHQSLEVGRNFVGSMTVFDGGHVDVAGDMFIGTFKPGFGDVVIESGGLLTVDGNLNIGNGTAGETESNGEGQMRIENGGILEFGSDKELRIGRREGSKGSLTVKGPDSKVLGGDAVTQGILVGLDGEGSLQLEEGAILGDADQDFRFGINEKGFGEFHVSHQSALKVDNLTIGDKGRGEGFVSGGGMLEVSEDLTIGKTNKGENKLTITGEGSKLDVGDELIVGDEGNGELMITSGGVLDMQGFNSKITLGKKQGSTGKLTLSTLDNLAADTQIIIGDEGSGELALQDGAELKMGDVILGDKESSFGKVSVKGEGALFEVEQNLTVSKNGGGAVQVTEGGALKTSTADASAKTILSSEESSPTSVILVDGPGSLWEANGEVVIGQKANGVLNIRNGGKVDAKKSITLGEEATGFGEINIGGLNDENALSPAQVTYHDELTVGKKGNARINVTKGGLFQGENVTPSVFIGDEANASGEVAVDGDGSKWLVDSTEGLVVGVFGSGTIDVTNGGLVEMDPASELILGGLSSAAKGTITLDGISEGALASRFLTGSNVTIGSQGEGRVDIFNGAEFKGAAGTDVTTNVGTQAGGKGIVNVDGEDSTWAPGDVTIGGDGSAQVTVKDLAIVDSNSVVIKGNTASETAVTVHNGKWDLFDFDMQGDSRLDIEGTDGVSTFAVHGDSTIRGANAGTPLVSLDGNFAQYDASNSDVLLDNATMLVNNGARVGAANMTVDGPGLLQFRNSSLADISNTMTVNKGLAQVTTGSVMNVEKNLQIGTLGTVDVTNGGVVNVGFNNIGTPDGAVSVTSGGTLSGSGKIIGNLFVGGETQPGFGNGGTVIPGSSPGILTVEGDVVFEKGSLLQLEVAGTEPGLFDKIVAKGKAVFEEGSKVVVNFIGGFAPKAGDNFAFFDYEEQTGLNALFSTANLTVTGLRPGFAFEGGFDTDGRFLLASLNDTTSTIPEPSTLMLLGSGLAGIFLRRKKNPPR